MGVADRSENLSEKTNNFKHTHQTMLLTIETGVFPTYNFLFQQDCPWNDTLTSPLHERAGLKALKIILTTE